MCKSFDEAAAVGARFVPHRVVARIVESDVITSLRLAPLDGTGVASFEPGQYLTLKLPGDLIRTYTISSSPGDLTSYRITVKREPPPSGNPGLPPGLGSGFLHDRAEIGSVIEVLDPRGAFVLDGGSARPVVLLSGGVGLTPMVSMLHRLAGSGRPVHFIHACENGRVHALRDEVLELARGHASIRTHFVYRLPTSEDVTGGRCDSEGIVTRDLLQSLLPLDDYDFYLCGPPGFMKAVYGLLLGMGVARPRIKYEFFGPATILDPDGATPELPQEPSPRAGDGAEIVFVRSGKSAHWGEFKGSLLDFAELQGLAPEFSCRTGICNTCECNLLEGSVRYDEQPLDTPAEGKLLICLARPVGGLLRLDL